VSSTNLPDEQIIFPVWRGSYFSPNSFPVILFTKSSRAQAEHVRASYASGLSVDVLSGTHLSLSGDNG
jgi:hypothetical protein